MSWVKHPVTLTGEIVELIPLERSHFPELEAIAADSRIWEFMSFKAQDPARFKELFEIALAEREKGNQYPFVVYHKKEQRLVGSTRFIDLMPLHKRLEIGWTWLDPAYWATSVNPECKLLLMTYAFETLGTYRVQYRTDENNQRSRKAIAKIGATYEGVLRYDIVRDNGTRRNSAYFSVLDTEWDVVKKNLMSRLLHNPRSN